MFSFVNEVHELVRGCIVVAYATNNSPRDRETRANLPYVHVQSFRDDSRR